MFFNILLGAAAAALICSAAQAEPSNDKHGIYTLIACQWTFDKDKELSKQFDVEAVCFCAAKTLSTPEAIAAMRTATDAGKKKRLDEALLPCMRSNQWKEKNR